MIASRPCVYVCVCVFAFALRQKNRKTVHTQSRMYPPVNSPCNVREHLVPTLNAIKTVFFLQISAAHSCALRTAMNCVGCGPFSLIRPDCAICAHGDGRNTRQVKVHRDGFSKDDCARARRLELRADAHVTGRDEIINKHVARTIGGRKSDIGHVDRRCFVIFVC